MRFAIKEETLNLNITTVHGIQKNIMKRNVIILLFVLVMVPVQSAMARTCYMEVTYSFNKNSAPAGKKVLGFKLFKNGKQVCQTTRHSRRTIKCRFQTAPGKYNFTVAPWYTDKSVGRRSAPYPVYIPKKTSGTWVTAPAPNKTNTSTASTGRTNTGSTRSSGPRPYISPAKVRTLTGVMGALNSLLLEEDVRR